ncbi:MAG: type II secretion system F family protein [Clostridium sp.]|uniref:type II secretion system F family protein n=1 Tax=Clostridium sp. TaxID=1506 RepID=UPI002A8AB042|nr:type II secretion system F family protein [Clostridium sp.]MDY5098262.1 type II secretion system F family protein [Clostridium sp.]
MVKEELKYKVLTKEGSIKKGIFEGSSDELKKFISQSGGHLIFFKESQAKKKEIIFRDSIISSKEMKNICSILYLYINAGISINEAIKNLSVKMKSKRLRSIFQDIYKDIVMGSGIYGSFSKFKNNFPSIFLILLKAGEKSGNLENTFKELEIYFYNKCIFTKKLQSNLSYPIILVICMKIVFLFILGKVLPQFNTLINSAEGRITSEVVFLQGISMFVNKNFIAILIVDFIIHGILILYLKNTRIYANFPIIKEYYKKLELIYFFKSFNILYKSGISIEETLSILRKSILNNELRKKICEVKNYICSGYGIYESFKLVDVLDDFSEDMIYFGEKTGDLEKSLSLIEENMRNSIEKSLESLLRFAEPIIIAIMGIFIIAFVTIFVMPTLNGLYYME